MGIRYKTLVRSILLRQNQFGGATSAAEIEEQYTAEVLADVIDGVDVPLTSLKDDILAMEASLAAMIGNSANTALRAYLLSSRAIDSGDDIPTEAEDGRRFIGRPEGFFSRASDHPLLLAPVTVVERAIRNVNGWQKIRHDIYAMEGSRVIFSVSKRSINAKGCCCATPDCNCLPGSAYFTACAYDPKAAATAYDAENGESVLPQELFALMRSMVLANTASENFLEGLAVSYGNLAAAEAGKFGLVYQQEG